MCNMLPPPSHFGANHHTLLFNRNNKYVTNLLVDTNNSPFCSVQYIVYMNSQKGGYSRQNLLILKLPPSSNVPPLNGLICNTHEKGGLNTNSPQVIMHLGITEC